MAMIQQGQPNIENKYNQQIAKGRDFTKVLEFQKARTVGGSWQDGKYPFVMSQQEVAFAEQASIANQIYVDQYGRSVNYLGNPVHQDEYGQIMDAFGNISNMASLDPWNFRDTQFKIHPREVEKIDKVVARVLRTVAVAPRLFRTVFNGKGNLEYKHHENIDAADPLMSKDFELYEPGLEALDQKVKHLLAVSKDYQIGQVKWDQSRLSNYLPTNIVERTVAEFTAMVADFKERMIWRGGDILTRNKGNTNIDAEVFGLVTDTNNINDIGVLATTAVAGQITTIGDLAKAFIELATPLINAHFPTPYNFVVTTGVILQGMKNRHATSDKTDLWNTGQLGMEKFGIPIVKNIVWTPHLLNEANDNTNQMITCFAPVDQAGRANQIIAESYPLWHRPLPLSLTFGLAGKIGWLGGGIIRRENSVTLTKDVTVDVFA